MVVEAVAKCAEYEIFADQAWFKWAQQALAAIHTQAILSGRGSVERSDAGGSQRNEKANVRRYASRTTRVHWTTAAAANTKIYPHRGS